MERSTVELTNLQPSLEEMKIHYFIRCMWKEGYISVKAVARMLENDSEVCANHGFSSVRTYRGGDLMFVKCISHSASRG